MSIYNQAWYIEEESTSTSTSDIELIISLVFYFVYMIVTVVLAYYYPLVINGHPEKLASCLIAFCFPMIYIIWIAVSNPIQPNEVKCDCASCFLTTFIVMTFWPLLLCLAPQEYWAVV